MSLMELCKLFGWQGGTIHQAEQELIRRAKIHDELVKALEVSSDYLDEQFGTNFSTDNRDLIKRAKEQQ